jgi:hypothetical protein
MITDTKKGCARRLNPISQLEVNMKDSAALKKKILPVDLQLSKLTLEQVRRIDMLLAEIDDYGEVRIIVQKGELRYISKINSYKLFDKEDRD